MSDYPSPPLRCWICNARLENKKNNQRFKCSLCAKTFHQLCVQKQFVDRVNGKYRCPICVLIEREENKCKCLDRIKHSQLCILNTIKQENSFPFENSLRQRIENGAFPTVEEFLIEIRNIYFNCNQSRSLETVLKKAEKEVEDYRLCIDCFTFRHDLNLYSFWFACVCDMPHIVIYAKVPTHPFWPAKAIRYIAENKTVLVKFFGTHDYGFPPLKNCYLLSETYPGKEPNTAQYNAAKDELEKHIRKIKCKFTGLFRYFPFKTVMNPQKLFLADYSDNYYSTNSDITEESDECASESESDMCNKKSENKFNSTPNINEEFLKPEYQPTVVIKRDAFIDFSARYSKSFDELMSIFSEIRQEQPPQKTCDSPEKEE